MDSLPQVEPASPPSSRKGRKTLSRSTRRKKAPETERNYVDIADRYAQRAINDADGKSFGLLFRLAASRYLKDRRRAAARSGAPFRFSHEHAHDVCSFLEKLPHVEGRWDSPTVVLHDSHIFFLVNLFGFRNLDGNRRFTSALFAVARKNAKSWLAAATLLYCLCCEDEPGAQLITAATTGSQARIVFNIAKHIVELTPDLQEAFGLETFSHSIAAQRMLANIRPINAKASTQDGLNPSHTCLDEIHAHKSSALLNVLQSASGARQNPLWLFTTTEGYETPGPWPEMRHYAKQLLNGLFEADHFLAVIFAVDEQIGHEGNPDYRPADDDFDESKWIKANPLMEVNPILAREIHKQAQDAKQMPSALAEFRIKRLNRQSSVASGWINLVKWRACSGAVDLDRLRKYPCYGGLDLSTTTDLTSFRLIWYVDRVIYTLGWCWVPEVAVKKRTERNLVPYRGWIDSGQLIQCPGDIIDYDLVAERVVWASKEFSLQKVGFDDWNSKQIEKKLVDAKVPMERVIQGPKSFHPAMKDLEEHYVTSRLAHGGAPVLAWCASNIVVRYDANRNMAPDKNRSPEKIDDLVALLNANAVRLAAAPPKQPRMMFV